MTHSNLKTKLKSLCTSAGIAKFHYGYLDDFDPDNREGTYPAMVITPVSRPLKTRSGDDRVSATMEVYVMTNWKREDTGTRETAWDLCDSKMLLFIAALQAGSDFSLTLPSAIPTELFPFGLSTDSVVAVKYTLDIVINC